MNADDLELKRTFQVGWNNPGQVLATTDKDELHKFVDKVIEAGANPIVINVLVETDQPAASVTPIGG